MRNIIGRPVQGGVDEDNLDANHTPEQSPGARIAGGSMGITPEVGGAMPSGVAPRVASRGPQPKRYRVVVGGFIMQSNCRVALRAGKEINDTQYDIAHIKKQGIRLEDIPDDTVPEPVTVGSALPPPETVEVRGGASLQPGGESESKVIDSPVKAGDPAATPMGPPATIETEEEQALKRRRR